MPPPAVDSATAAMPLRHFKLLLSTGINMHVVQVSPPAGVPAKGTVLCVHGFPDTWYGYRHQLRPIASCGWHVLVPDQRGYGETDVPRKVSQYRIQELCADMCALMDALGLDQVVLLGHDWGGQLVWNMTLQHKERVAAVASVCTPFFPNNPDKNPWLSMKANPGRFDYQIWHNMAESELELSEDPRYTVKVTIRGTDREEERRFWGAGSPEVARLPPTVRGGQLKGLPPDDRCQRSSILSDADLSYYAAQFTNSGYFGPVSWYRNVERNWEWMRSTAGQRVLQPALMLSAGRDPVLKPSMVKSLKMDEWIPGLVHKHIEDAGHWVLQEKPQEANQIICEWLSSLPPIRSTYLSRL